MNICGLQKLAMVDYPGKLAATVFTGGCNLRCPFCHNPLLVTRTAESPPLEQADILAFLNSRRGLRHRPGAPERRAADGRVRSL